MPCRDGRFEDASGTNLAAIYHPPAYVERELRAHVSEPLEHVAATHPESPHTNGQDAYLARRR